MVTQINGQSTLKLQADVIDIDGLITALSAKDIGCANLTVQNNVGVNGNLSTEGYIFTESYLWADSIRVGSSSTGATWQSTSVVVGITYGNSTSHFFLYGTVADGPTGSTGGHVVSAVNKDTLHYLGRAPT